MNGDVGKGSKQTLDDTVLTDLTSCRTSLICSETTNTSSTSPLAWVNLLGMLLLLKPAKKVMDDYLRQKKAGLDPVFDPEKCGIENADLWKDIVKESYSDVQ